MPENLYNINFLNYDLLINQINKNNQEKEKKFIIILNEDQKLNRNLLRQAEKLAKLNPKMKFYLMYNTNENKKLINEKFGLEFKNYPQLLILESEKNISVFPIDDLLSFRLDLNSLNNKLKSLI